MNSSPTAGPAPLGQLLSEAFEYSKAHARELFLGALVFGALIGILNAGFGTHVQRAVNQGMEDMGIDTERMQELSARMEAGDEQAMVELEAMLNGMQGGAAAKQMMGTMGAAMPYFGLATLLGLLISFVAYAYYALVAVEGKDLNTTIARAQKVLLPLTGVSIWSFLRSFIWIPIIGIIPAIILCPRFIAAPLIFLTEGKGVTASVSSSYARTRGYWGKIFGNSLVAAIIMIVVSIVLHVVLNVALSSAPIVLLVLSQIIAQCLMAVMIVFSVRLAHTVLQHPRA